MINPVTIIKLLNDRHDFIKNHPELFPFLQEAFEAGIDEDTVIEIHVKKRGEPESRIEIPVQKSELPFLSSVKKVIRQITE